MKRFHYFVAFISVILLGGQQVYAQFNTISDVRNQPFEQLQKRKDNSDNIKIQQDTIIATFISEQDSIVEHENKVRPKISSKKPVRKKHIAKMNHIDGLPDLTIANLLQEIRKNGIQHEKVVLAQAILETGWFTSNVCRTKNNLFGLTNPRTGKYYEFNHWTESVKAYYTKVQYRYKGGNYLLWLDKIGYAEDKVYVQSLIRLMQQYFIAPNNKNSET